MKRGIVVGALLVCWPVAMASAERCIGPKDVANVGALPTPIVFCDDFDTYCGVNSTANIKWPGYPPSPDTTLCTDPGNGSDGWLKAEWVRLFTSAPWVVYSITTPGHDRQEGWDGNPGWVTEPYFVNVPGNDLGPPRDGSGYMTWSLNTAITDSLGSHLSPIDQAFPPTGTWDSVNGTDTNPLVLRYWTNDDSSLGAPAGWNRPVTWLFYGELYLKTGSNVSTDRAPTDFTMAAATNPQCVSELRDYPVICQQDPTYGILGRPSTCPPRSTTVHRSLAFGWLAPLDTDPCDVDGGRQPTTNHAATFDGLYWRLLVSNQGGAVGDFNYGMQQGMFEMTIKSGAYDLRLRAPHTSGDPSGYTIETNTITIPRRYTGPFSAVAFGVNAGCELDPAGDGETCNAASAHFATRSSAPWKYAQYQTTPVTYVTHSAVNFDRPIVAGGVGAVSSGACCVQTGVNAGTCTNNVKQSDCTGLWHGAGSTCETSAACCPMPFADADHDGDVDQDDFGAFQVCYTGTTSGVPAECKCFNRNTDTVIDGTDLTAFLGCWTGPNVTWSATLLPAPGCQP